MTAPTRKKAQPAKKAAGAKPSGPNGAKASKAAKAAPAKAAAVKEAAVPRPRARAASATPAPVQPVFQEPAVPAEEVAGDVIGEAPEPAAPAAEVDGERYVNGVRVVGYETLYSPRSYKSGPKAGQRAPMTKRHLVVLEDGSKVNGCTGCRFTGSLNEVITHVRNIEHPEPTPEPGGEETLLLAEDMPKQKAGGTSVPSQVLMLTIGQVIQYGLNTGAWERDRARMQAKLQEEQERRVAAEKEVKRLTAELGKIGAVLQRAAGTTAKVEG